MRKLLTALCWAVSAVSVTAEVYNFDFHNPETLTPAVAAPGEKQAVDLNGKSFVSGKVTISFAASTGGNTHVRLYHSYDAGIDLRLYDEDQMTVAVSDGGILKSIQFTMSLSGAATGTNDINFIPDNGEFSWADELWTASEQVGSVTLTSAMQSRIYTMAVKVEDNSSIQQVEAKEADIYYDLQGKKLSCKPKSGLYIKDRKVLL